MDMSGMHLGTRNQKKQYNTHPRWDFCYLLWRSGFSLVFNFCVKVVDLQTCTDQKHPKTEAGGAILGSIHSIFPFHND